MKRIFLYLILGIIIISVLFKGLFFELESYIFFLMINTFSSGYIISKVYAKERLVFDKNIIEASLVLLVAVILSFINSSYLRGNITSGLQFTTYILTSVAVYDYFSRVNRKSHNLLLFISLTAFIAALVGLSGHTGVSGIDILTDTILGKRLNSTFQYANTAGIYFGLSFFIAFTGIKRNQNIIIKAFLSGISSVLLLSMFLTGSRGTYLFFLIVFIFFVCMIPTGFRLRSLGSLVYIISAFAMCLKGYETNADIANYISAFKWVTLCFGISVLGSLIFDLVITLIYRRYLSSVVLKYKSFKFVGILVVLLATVAASIPAVTYLRSIIPPDIMSRLTSINFTANSVIDRFSLYKTALFMIKDKWLLGYGGGGWTALYQRFYYTFFARSVHNHFLQIFVEHGIIGFLSYVSITLMAFASYIYAYIYTKDKRDKLTIAGFFAAYAALTLHSAIDFDLTFNSMALLWWTFVGLAGAFAHRASEERGVKNMFAGVSSNIPLYAALILSVGLIWPTAAYSTSAYYAEKAYNYRDNADIPNAIIYYEKAASIDGMNAANYCTLAELYNRQAANSEKQEQMAFWRSKALEAGENSVRLNPNYPYYNYVLTMIYFDAGEAVKALDQALKLRMNQPLYKPNYEIVARGYMEAGLQYYREGNIEKARQCMWSCSRLEMGIDYPLTTNLRFYKGKALLLQKKFTEAEALIKLVRADTKIELDMKIECDRLLYIINQQTGKSADNAKYKGVLYMGMVEKTPLYIEVTKIIKDGVLALP